MVLLRVWAEIKGLEALDTCHEVTMWQLPLPVEMYFILVNVGVLAPPLSHLFRLFLQGAKAMLPTTFP